MDSIEITPAHLPEDPWRYFYPRPGWTLLDLEAIPVTHRVPPADEIAETAGLMAEAYRGERTKREPISVQREADGSYSILKGHRTTAVARACGWLRIPAVISE